MAERFERRQFVRLGLGGAMALPLVGGTQALANDLPVRTLGRTGVRVGIFGLGCGMTTVRHGEPENAAALVNRALDLGVTYIDTAASYGNSERHIGLVASKRRSEMFLATKTTRRRRDDAWFELERSLKRLQTDRIDLWQMHGVADGGDTRVAFGPDGVVRALEEAKAQKLVRFAGVTGHANTPALVEWLRRYPFDTVLTVVNACDVHHPDSFVRRVLPVARERGTAVIAMKVPAYGKVLNPSRGVTMREALHYALSQPGVACGIVACDSIAQLEENVALARELSAPLAAGVCRDIEALTADYWQQAMFYRDWS